MGSEVEPPSPEDATGTVSRPSGKEDKSGVIYLSRIPPSMTPHEIRGYLEPFGRIGRVYLAPGEKASRERRLPAKDPRSRRRACFTEGWVEFLRKKDARSVALALNGALIGGKKSNRFHDDLWNIKYLEGFKWSNLHEEQAYERAVRQQKLRTEIAQARRVNAHYLKQVERAHELSKIEEKRAAKRGTETTKGERIQQQLQALKHKFKQRKPILGKDVGPSA